MPENFQVVGIEGKPLSLLIKDSIKIIKKEFNKVMLVSTGALLSPTSTLQKQTIPSVAHGVVIVNE